MADVERCTLGMQIACVIREVGMREQTYPRLVGTKKMTRSQAEIEIACMRAVLNTLMELQHKGERDANAR